MVVIVIMCLATPLLIAIGSVDTDREAQVALPLPLHVDQPTPH